MKKIAIILKHDHNQNRSIVPLWKRRIETHGDRDMSKILKEVLEANKDYVSTFGDKGKLELPPKRQFAILTYGCATGSCKVCRVV